MLIDQHLPLKSTSFMLIVLVTYQYVDAPDIQLYTYFLLIDLKQYQVEHRNLHQQCVHLSTDFHLAILYNVMHRLYLYNLGGQYSQHRDVLGLVDKLLLISIF